MLRTKSIIGYFFIYVLICLMSTFYRAWFPSLAQTQWLLIAATVLSFFVNVEFYKSKAFIWLLVYLVVLLGNRFSGDLYFKEISTCFFEFMIPLFAMNLYYYSKQQMDQTYNRVLIVVLFIIIAIVTVGSIAANQVLPEIVRNMTHTTGGDMEQLNDYYRLGVSNYLLPHALPALIPLQVYALKQNQKGSREWFFYLAFLILCLLLIYYSASSGAILLSMLALTLSILTNKEGISKQRIFVLGLIFLPLLISNSLMNGLIQILIDIFGGSNSAQSFTEHLIDMSNSLTTEGGAHGDVGDRGVKYQQTFDAIFSNFLFGTNGESGGHMALLDRLARLGIVGFIPLIATYVTFLKPITQQISQSVKPFFVESLAIAFMMMTLKNMINLEMNVVLFAMIPIMAVYYSRYLSNESDDLYMN